MIVSKASLRLSSFNLLQASHQASEASNKHETKALFASESKRQSKKPDLDLHISYIRKHGSRYIQNNQELGEKRKTR